MPRLDIDEDQAFSYVRRVSSRSNRKLGDIAAEIVRTRALPETGWRELETVPAAVTQHRGRLLSDAGP